MPLRVAVLGAGTVGREVVRRLQARDDVVLVGVAVRDVDRALAAGLPADLLTDAPAHLVAAPDTDVIVELMGGDEPARTVVDAALGAGKAVVTANKHVIAHHGPALETVARRTGAALRFEAAVGGGIPVLAPLAGDLAANRVTRVRGIVNGTTNHILSAMASGDRTYEAVLREAQELGFAEADPSGDVEGLDAANKLVILARLAFGAWVDPNLIDRRPPMLAGPGSPGITGVTSVEVAGGHALGLSLRFVVSASVDGPGPAGLLTLSALPTAVPSATPLGATGGANNRIEITADPVGAVGFDGPGAGGPETSSAVLGDILAIARGCGSTWDGLPSAAVRPPEDIADGLTEPREWFMVLPGVARGRVVERIAAASADVDGGLAVRTVPIELDEVRRRIVEAAPDTLHATLYPVLP